MRIAGFSEKGRDDFKDLDVELRVPDILVYEDGTVIFGGSTRAVLTPGEYGALIVSLRRGLKGLPGQLTIRNGRDLATIDVDPGGDYQRVSFATNPLDAGYPRRLATAYIAFKAVDRLSARAVSNASEAVAVGYGCSSTDAFGDASAPTSWPSGLPEPVQNHVNHCASIDILRGPAAEAARSACRNIDVVPSVSPTPQFVRSGVTYSCIWRDALPDEQ